MTLWDHLNNITYGKKYWHQLNEAEKSTANLYMINRFVSMNYEYIELINESQKLNMTLPMAYNLYVSLIPKQKTFFKYIKKTLKEEKSDSVKLIAEVFKVSQREAKDYIKLLKEDQIKELEQQITGK
jgi:hypothetical protein